MTQVTTIETSEGVAKIDADLFQGYLKEAFEHLDDVKEVQKSYKEVVETVAETTGLKKATVNKYFKQRHKAETAKTKALGELFSMLDEVVQS